MNFRARARARARVRARVRVLVRRAREGTHFQTCIQGRVVRHVV